MINDPYEKIGIRQVINAAGKMTALGGTAQKEAVAKAQSLAAQSHVDISELRQLAGKKIAAVTGAEAATITNGAASGIAIATAAVITGTNIEKIKSVPFVDGPNQILLQKGHDINFGADITQMISMGGGRPVTYGSKKCVTNSDLESAITKQTAALLYVKSHHCIQENRLPIDALVSKDLPVIVDAAAEVNLRSHIRSGANLVTYSGGKAIGGPTSGFIAGDARMIEACELQQMGIGRAMKVGKEQIMGLLVALEQVAESTSANEDVMQALFKALGTFSLLKVSIEPDRAGRDIKRVGLRSTHFPIIDLVNHLERGNPSIRTRNHQMLDGLILFDVRELQSQHVAIIHHRVADFFRPHAT